MSGNGMIIAAVCWIWSKVGKTGEGCERYIVMYVMYTKQSAIR